jgi:hypothetical protein
MKNNFFKNLKLYSDVYKAGSEISLSNEKHLKLVLKNIGWRIVTLCLLSTKETSRFRMLHNFGSFIIKMNRNHGEVYTVKYLKACQLAIQKKLAGQPFSSLREIEPDYNFPRLSKSGLPSIIKTVDRASICNNSYRIIRLYLSLFSIYRVIKLPFNPKLATITSPFTGSVEHLDDFNLWLSNNSRVWLQKFWSVPDLSAKRVLPILKACPAGGRSFSKLIESYIGLKNNKIVFESVKEYIKRTNSSNLEVVFENIEYFLIRNPEISYDPSAPIGRLSFKEEAAGKLRVFAMVDVITQSLLKPLHDELFGLFKKIPNDSTHNQDKAYKYAQELSLKYKASFGFDLSSATDRLPISSQVSILNNLYGIGELWKSILVDREYTIRSNSYGIPLDPVKYAVGQPMGALSSWAMLNLMHHMMIQFIAYSMGKTRRGQWYVEYLVLGDDLVLFEKDVADRYLTLCKELGVEINLSKSIVSENRPVLEFAKRTSINGVDVSAVSIKELIVSNNFFGRLALTTRLISRGWGKDMFKLLVIGNKRSKDKTIDRIYPLIGFLTQLYQNGAIPFSSVISLITSRDKPLSFFGRDIRWMTPGTISKVVKNYFKTGTVDPNLIPVKDRFFSEVNSITFKSILLHKIDKLVTKLDSLDRYKHRVNILDHLWSSKELETFLKSVKDLELSKPLVDRKYWKDLPKPLRLIYLKYCYLSESFLIRDNSKLANMKYLNLGMDVDLLAARSLLAKTGPMWWELRYLRNFRNRDQNNFWNTQAFIDLKLSDLLNDWEKLKLIEKDLLFYLPKEETHKEVIDNPLKILDFIKDINNPTYKVKSDFVKWNNQYIDSEALVDESPGFKPKFNFGQKTIDFKF